MLVIDDLTRPAPEVETPFTFPLDPFQKYACAAIAAEENVLVTAKTGSGKTLVGEFQIHYSLGKGKRVFYTTPIKSLSNQKFHDLKQQFPSVGIVTGDIQFCPQADVVILTTEILRNLLFKQGGPTEGVGLTAGLSLQDLDAVVFDEVHYINDPERGKVWEECLMLLPASVRLVLLSATLDAPERLAGWLGDLKKVPIHLISTSYRLVPLVHCVQRGELRETVMDARNTFSAEAYQRWIRDRESAQEKADKHAKAVRARDGDAISRGDARVYSFLHQMNAMVRRLQSQNLLPALFFVLSRRKCEEYAAKVEDTLIDSSDAAAIRHIVSFHLHRFPYLETLPAYHSLLTLLQKGVAFHHSGMLPVLREIVEILFGKGLLKVLFATETFAVGINMPTKTVVFTSYEKPDDHGGRRMLRTDEYLQMAGRAGRRGKDTEGWVFYLPDREPSSVHEVQSMMTGKACRVVSKMDFHYDFVLSSALSGKDLLPGSYWMREQEEGQDAIRREIAELTTEYESDDSEYADRQSLEIMIRETGNAARKKAQRALEQWKDSHLGPKWEIGWKRFLAKHERGIQRARLENELADLQQVRVVLNDHVAYLQRMGFLEGTTLTKRGQMASEVHEAHPLLLTMAVEDRLFDKLTQDEILVALSVFLECPSGQEEPFLDQVALSPGSQNSLVSLAYVAQQMFQEETRKSRPGYWDLHTFWIPATRDWINGVLPQEIQEGTFVRSMLKLCNIVDELTTLLTMQANVDVLDTLKDAKQRILRDIVRPESLYLRL